MIDHGTVATIIGIGTLFAGFAIDDGHAAISGKLLAAKGAADEAGKQVYAPGPGLPYVPG